MAILHWKVCNRFFSIPFQSQPTSLHITIHPNPSEISPPPILTLSYIHFALGKPEDRVTTDRQEAIAQYLNSQNPDYRFTVEESDSEFFAEVTWDHGPIATLPMKAVVHPYKLHKHPRSHVQARQVGGVRFNPLTKKPVPTNAKDQQKLQRRVQDVSNGSISKNENRAVPESILSNNSTKKMAPGTNDQHRIEQVPRGSPKMDDDRGVPERDGRYSRAGSDSGVSMVDEPVSKGLRRSTRKRRPVRRY